MWKMKLRQWRFEKHLSDRDKRIIVAKAEKRAKDGNLSVPSGERSQFYSVPNLDARDIPKDLRSGFLDESNQSFPSWVNLTSHFNGNFETEENSRVLTYDQSIESALQGGVVDDAAFHDWQPQPRQVSAVEPSAGQASFVETTMPDLYHHTPEALKPHQGGLSPVSPRLMSPTIPNNRLPPVMANLQAQQHQFIMPSNEAFSCKTELLLSHTNSDSPSETSPPHPSPDFPIFQSNADLHPLHNDYTDPSDPPDLHESLHEEQLPPPPEDLNPSDPDFAVHEQDIRFDGDLYTPRWVCGHGNKREGWCGICEPGRWLVLKNSEFWYDKSFTHRISAATGCRFEEPQEIRRMDGNPDVWEALCRCCSEWVALVSSKKKGSTWFRPAYKVSLLKRIPLLMS
jgi:hypothetical protein